MIVRPPLEKVTLSPLFLRLPPRFSCCHRVSNVADGDSYVETVAEFKTGLRFPREVCQLSSLGNALIWHNGEFGNSLNIADTTSKAPLPLSRLTDDLRVITPISRLILTPRPLACIDSPTA